MARKSTRNAQGAGTIRQRPDGRWEARFTIGRDPGTGKQKQKSIYGATQAEVRKKLQQATVSIDEGTYIEQTKLTVSKWIDIWLNEYVINTIKASTLCIYKEQCKNHINPAMGAIKLTELSPHTVQKFYNALHRGTEEKAGLSPKTIKNIHGVLHKALKQALQLGYIKSNPSDVCKLPKVIRKEIRPLDENDIVLFLKAIKGHQFETLYMVDLFTGMRQGEILGLKWDCVDFEKGTIVIDKQLQREKKVGGKYILTSIKNNKSRLILPAPSIMTVLKNHREKQLEMKELAGSMWCDSNFVFTNELGNNLLHGTVYRNFKKVIRDIGLPATRFHDLRHSYAVASLQSGDDPKTVQENLGHHTAAFTLDEYGHVTERMRRASSQRMEGFINEVTKM